MAVYADAELFQQPHGHGARGYPGGGLAGAGPFQYVAYVVETILHGARQIGVAGPNSGHPLGSFNLVQALHRLHRHCFPPVGPVFVLQGHAYGAAQGIAVSHAGHDVGPILLDEHPTAPAVASLPPSQVGADVLFSQS